MQLKNTALTEVHQKLGARMVPFAGFNMPVRYSSDIEEHKTVRKEVGIFDVSHMGEFMVRGPKALELIQWISSNDASKLVDGAAQYSCFPNDQGGIVDDFLTYRLNPEDFMLVVNASNIEKDWEWINQQNTMGAELENISDQMSLFAVQGPAATDVLRSLTAIDLEGMKFYTFERGVFAGAENAIVSATGYTGSGGFEIYIDNQYAEQVWENILEAGKPFGIKPIGLGARDTLRLEMGFCLYGNDIDDHTSPMEAGLSWITKFTKDFVNSRQLKLQKEEGTSKRLVAFQMVDRGIPRQHYQIKNEQGESIGNVTSGTMSPMLSTGIGMGYVQTAYASPQTNIQIEVRKRLLSAEVVRLPFYKG